MYGQERKHFSLNLFYKQTVELIFPVKSLMLRLSEDIGKGWWLVMSNSVDSVPVNCCCMRLCSEQWWFLSKVFRAWALPSEVHRGMWISPVRRPPASAQDSRFAMLMALCLWFSFEPDLIACLRLTEVQLTRLVQAGERIPQSHIFLFF